MRTREPGAYSAPNVPLAPLLLTLVSTLGTPPWIVVDGVMLVLECEYR
jgi:hypothetical protein